jgi:cell division protein FtsN
MSNGANKGKVIAGVFIGMVLGITAAGGVAWYVVNKNPTEFTGKDKSKPAPQVVAPAGTPVAATTPASGVAETKQQFEFYKVLTDKSDGTAHKSPPKQQATLKPQPASPGGESKDLYFVQAGSFQNVGDAEKLKAKLAFSGFEANIQTATIPDKGVWHRVRLGPYNGSEAGKTIAALQQNGIIATQVHAQ